jgi:hypothetical protein
LGWEAMATSAFALSAKSSVVGRHICRVGQNHTYQQK